MPTVGDRWRMEHLRYMHRELQAWRRSTRAPMQVLTLVLVHSHLPLRSCTPIPCA